MKLNSKQIIQLVASGQMTVEEADKELSTATATATNVHYSVSPKGAISFYGVRKGRFPITLYLNELKSLVAAVTGLGLEDDQFSEEFQEFLNEAGDTLKCV